MNTVLKTKLSTWGVIIALIIMAAAAIVGIVLGSVAIYRQNDTPQVKIIVPSTPYTPSNPEAEVSSVHELHKNEKITGFAMSKDGQTIAAGGSTTTIYTRVEDEWKKDTTLEPFDSNDITITALAFNDDGTVIAVASYEGVWIFVKIADTWMQQGSKLTGRDSTVGSLFGHCVSLDDVGDTLVVGGPGDNDNNGAMWIFKRYGTNWSQQGLKFSGSRQQGQYVKISGNGQRVISCENQHSYINIYSISKKDNEWEKEHSLLVDWHENVDIDYTGTTIVTSVHNHIHIYVRSEDSWELGHEQMCSNGPSNPAHINSITARINGDGNKLVLLKHGVSVSQGLCISTVTFDQNMFSSSWVRKDLEIYPDQGLENVLYTDSKCEIIAIVSEQNWTIHTL